MALHELLNKPLQFIMFGGKGGVGKTTMAAAVALRLAKKYSKRKVLIFTTDPAPSLGDVFAQKITDKPTAINGINNLFAMEIDAKKVFEEFKEEYGDDILDILQKGTYLEDEETENMFNLDIPGLDEIMGLKKITDFMNNQKYQSYIVDTAPTGHTLRLLTLPDLLDKWIKFLAGLRWKYHAMVTQFARREVIEKADRFLLEMKKTVKTVKKLLQDCEKTEFIVVTIPEAMGVAETEDLISNLEKFEIPNHHIIINNVFPREASSFAKARRHFQEKHINTIKKQFGDHSITEITLQPNEIRGIPSLRELEKQLFR